MQVLKVYPFPITITTFQFSVGAVLVLFMWSTNLYKKPKISSGQVTVSLVILPYDCPRYIMKLIFWLWMYSQLVAILPLAIVHTLGNLFTNMSLGKVAVSFTHTIKAMEPFFSVILSALFLGEVSCLILFYLFIYLLLDGSFKSNRINFDVWSLPGWLWSIPAINS